MDVTLVGDVASAPRYRVADFVARENDAAGPAMQRMQSGHYKAYVHCGTQWYELNDSNVIALSSPPTYSPYIVFLESIHC